MAPARSTRPRAAPRRDRTRPPVRPRPRRRRHPDLRAAAPPHRRKAAARPSRRWALEAITDGVAFVRDPQQNLLATNVLGRAFFASVIGDGGRVPNLARFQFLDPASRDFYPDWDRFAEMCVGVLRAEAGRDPHDRGLQDLVGELSAEPGLVLLVYTAEPGSPSAERLRLLASWAATATTAAVRDTEGT